MTMPKDTNSQYGQVKKRGNPCPVSRKGVPNKYTKEIREMIRGALDDAGGQAYLARQANENPVAFMGLIGKIIPKEVEMKLDQRTDSIKIVNAEDTVKRDAV